jgi:hypothetical protein
VSADPPPPPKVSPDGKFYWDGQRWVPNQQLAPQQPASVVVYGQPTNSLAVGALIAGIAAWVVCPVIAATVAVVLGHNARGQMRRTGEGGGGMAMAGLILGYIQLAAVALIRVFWIGGAFLVGLIGATTRH